MEFRKSIVLKRRLTDLDNGNRCFASESDEFRIGPNLAIETTLTYIIFLSFESLLCLVGLVFVTLWFCAQCFFYPHRDQCECSLFGFINVRAYSFLWKSSSINVCACALHTHTRTTHSITHSLTSCIHSRIFFEAAKITTTSTIESNSKEIERRKKNELWIKLEFHRSRLVSNWLARLRFNILLA